MTRGGGETVVLRPTNNMYTVLAGVAVLVQIIGLVVVLLRMQDQFGSMFPQ